LNNFYLLALQQIPSLFLSKGLGEGSKAFRFTGRTKATN